MYQSRSRQSGRSHEPSVVPVSHLETEMFSVRVGQTISVQVIHVENYMSFFCQLCTKIVARDEMMDKLNAYCRSLSTDEGGIDYIEPGMHCVARFSEDGGWYRARIIKQTTRTDYMVHYIDYGNSEAVNIRDMKDLPPQFSRLPAQAVECSLARIPRQTRDAEATQKLMSLTDGRNLKAKAITVSGMKLEVDLFDEVSGKSINQEIGNLCGHDREQPQISSKRHVVPKVSKKQTYAKRTLPLRKPVSVYPSHIESPIKFFLQFANEEDQLTNLATELNDSYSAMSANQLRLKNAAVGEVCVARFSEDDSWYRAKILEFSGMEATVQFLDYGNTDISSAVELKGVVEKYLNIPAFAVECTLNVVEGVSSVQASKFKELMMAEDAEVVAEFLESRAETIPVKVAVNGNDVTRTLGLTLDTKQPSYKTPLVSSGVKVKVVPTSIESPNLLYLQVAALEEESQAFVDTVNSYYTNIGMNELVVSDATEGMPCVAQFSDDQAWYRATITNLTENQATVTFVDFGNSDVVPLDNIKTVTSEFMDNPPYAIPCKLRNVTEPTAGWSDELCAKLEEILTEEDILIAAEFHSNTMPVDVDLFVNTRNLVDALKLEEYHRKEEEESDVAEIEESLPAYPTPSIAEGEVTACISSSLSPIDFYIRLLDAEAELATYSAKLQDDYSRLTSLKRVQEQIDVLQAGVDLLKEDEAVTDTKSNVETEKQDEGAGGVSEQDAKTQIDTDNEEEIEELQVEKESQEYDSAYEGEEQLGAQPEVDVVIEESTEQEDEKDVIESQETENEETSVDNVVSEKEEKEQTEEVVTQNQLQEDTPEQEVVIDSSREEEQAAGGEFEVKEEVIEKLEEECELEKEVHRDPESDTCKELAENEKLGTEAEDEGQESEKVDVISQDHTQNINDVDCVEKEAAEFEVSSVETGDVQEEVENVGKAEDFLDRENREETIAATYDEEQEAAAGLENNEESQKDQAEKQVEESIKEDNLEEEPVLYEVQEEAETSDDVEAKDAEAEINLDLDLVDVKVGMACVVKCVENNTWYRAILTSLEGTEANVILIDYGRAATVDVESLKRVTEEHLGRAPFAYHCQLNGIKEPTHGWKPEDNDTFKAVVDESIFNVLFTTCTEPFKVTISVDGEDILKKLPEEWSSHEVVEPVAQELSSPDESSRNTHVCGEENDGLEDASEILEEGSTAQQNCNYPVQNLNSGHIFHAYASEVKSPSQFYLQLVSQESDLSDLAEEVNEFYNRNLDVVKPLTDAKVNKPCVAQYTDEDGNAAWYRAKIVEIQDDIATVVFVDYGNSESVHVSELKEVTDKYLEIKPYAVYCQMDNQVKEDAAERFTEIILEADELIAEVVDESEPITVKLSVDGRDIESLLGEESNVAEDKSDEHTKDDIGLEQLKVEDEAAQYATPDVPDQDGVEVDGMSVGFFCLHCTSIAGKCIETKHVETQFHFK